MRGPSSLNEWRADQGDLVLPFYTSRLVNGGPSMLPIYPTGRAWSPTGARALELIGMSSWAKLSHWAHFQACPLSLP